MECVHILDVDLKQRRVWVRVTDPYDPRETADLGFLVSPDGEVGGEIKNPRVPREWFFTARREALRAFKEKRKKAGIVGKRMRQKKLPGISF